MGMLGLTAYSGMALQCQPKAGETVVVSAASGGVGQIAGQIAKISRCRVVGIAGIQEKCDFVTDVLGLTRVSHKSPTLAEDLGRPALLVSMRILRTSAARCSRLCCRCSIGRRASVSVDSSRSMAAPRRATRTTPGWPRARPPSSASTSRCTVCMCGTLSTSTRPTFWPRWLTWIRQGKVKYKEDLWPGLAQAPKAFRAMLEGGNFGKTLVGIGEDPTLDAALQARRASTNVLQH